MEIEYTVSQEDMAEFSVHYWEHSAVAQSGVQKQRWNGAGFVALMGGLVFLVTRDVALGIAFLVGAVTHLFFSTQARVRERFRARVLRLRQEGSDDFCGLRTLCIEADGLREVSETSDTKLKWVRIGRIDSTDTHTFIYIGTAKAFVIPEGAVTKGDYKAFVAAVRQHWEQAKPPLKPA